MKKIKNGDKVSIDHSQFINKDGYPKGGVEVKIPEGIPTTNKVNGQKRMLAEKRSTVKWY